MCGIVIFSRIMDIDPDNVATPIAAALGDICTLLLLTITGTVLHSMNANLMMVICGCAIGFFLLILLPLAYQYVKSRPAEYAILTDKACWVAVLSAMMISSGAGIILQQSVTRFQSLAVLAPVMNGMGGNLAVVHASKLSTALHTDSRISKLRNAIVLFLLVIPTSYIFIFIIKGLNLGHTIVNGAFLVGYSIAALSQVGLLLLVGTKLVAFVWARDFDPDQVAIPFVTALGDLVGTGALVTCFSLLAQVGVNE